MNYKEHLEEVPFLKVNVLVKEAGITMHMYNNLEERQYGQKKEAYRTLLKSIRNVAEICHRMSKAEDPSLEGKQYFKSTFFKGMTTADIKEAFLMAYEDVKAAYTDMLSSYKELKAEEDHQDLEEDVKVEMFNDEEDVEDVEDDVVEDTAMVTKTRVASVESRAAFLRTEAGVVRRKE